MTDDSVSSSSGWLGKFVETVADGASKAVDVTKSGLQTVVDVTKTIGSSVSDSGASGGSGGLNTSDPRIAAKIAAFSSELDICLVSFDKAREWADLITYLQRIIKICSKYPALPITEKDLISKRLAQCINSALPSGVHLKALEVYEVVLLRETPESMETSIRYWSTGLFPLLSSAATQVKPAVLRLFKERVLTMGPRLQCCLPGVLTALLPNIEDTASESYSLARSLVDQISEAVSPTYFYATLWDSLVTCRAIRLPCLTLLLEGVQASVPMQLEQSAVCTSISAALFDPSVLTVRSCLDLLLAAPFLKRSQLSAAHRQMLTSSLLQLLGRRDGSLTRRIVQWLGDTDVAGQPPRIGRDIILYVVQSMKDMLGNQPNSESIQSCVRILLVMKNAFLWPDEPSKIDVHFVLLRAAAASLSDATVLRAVISVFADLSWNDAVGLCDTLLSNAECRSGSFLNACLHFLVKHVDALASSNVNRTRFCCKVVDAIFAWALEPRSVQDDEQLLLLIACLSALQMQAQDHFSEDFCERCSSCRNTCERFECESPSEPLQNWIPLLCEADSSILCESVLVLWIAFCDSAANVAVPARSVLAMFLDHLELLRRHALAFARATECISHMCNCVLSSVSDAQAGDLVRTLWAEACKSPMLVVPVAKCIVRFAFHPELSLLSIKATAALVASDERSENESKATLLLLSSLHQLFEEQQLLHPAVFCCCLERSSNHVGHSYGGGQILYGYAEGEDSDSFMYIRRPFAPVVLLVASLALQSCNDGRNGKRQFLSQALRMLLRKSAGVFIPIACELMTVDGCFYGSLDTSRVTVLSRMLAHALRCDPSSAAALTSSLPAVDADGLDVLYSKWTESYAQKPVKLKSILNFRPTTLADHLFVALLRHLCESCIVDLDADCSRKFGETIIAICDCLCAILRSCASSRAIVYSSKVMKCIEFCIQHQKQSAALNSCSVILIHSCNAALKHIGALKGGPVEEHVARIRNITLRLINSAVLQLDEACIDPWIWLISSGHINPLVQSPAASGDSSDLQSYFMVLGTLCSDLLETSRLCSSPAGSASVALPESVLWKKLMAAHLLFLRILRGGSPTFVHPISTECAKNKPASPDFYLYAHEVITDILSQSDLSHFSQFSCPFDAVELQQLESHAPQALAGSLDSDVAPPVEDGGYLDDMARNLSGIMSSVMGASSEAAIQATSKINVLLGLLFPGLFKAGFVLWSLPRKHSAGNGSMSVRVIVSAILQDCMMNAAAVATRSILIVWDKSCSFCASEARQAAPGFGTWAEGFGGVHSWLSGVKHQPSISVPGVSGMCAGPLRVAVLDSLLSCNVNPVTLMENLGQALLESLKGAKYERFVYGTASSASDQAIQGLTSHFSPLAALSMMELLLLRCPSEAAAESAMNAIQTSYFSSKLKLLLPGATICRMELPNQHHVVGGWWDISMAMLLVVHRSAACGRVLPADRVARKETLRFVSVLLTLVCDIACDRFHNDSSFVWPCDVFHPCIHACRVLSVAAPSILEMIAEDLDRGGSQSFSCCGEVIAQTLRGWRFDSNSSAPIRRPHPLHRAALIACLCSLSSSPAAFRFWKAAVLELFYDDAFFACDIACLRLWKKTIDVALSSSRDALDEICSRYGGTNLSAAEASAAARTQQLQRLSFALLCGEEDQYIYHLPFLMERLNDCFKSSRSSPAPPRFLIMAFVLCRCIILRFSEANLGQAALSAARSLPSLILFAASLWPTLLHEIRRLLVLWLQASAGGSVVWDGAASACFDILECLWTTAPDSWSFQAWAFRSILSPIASMPSDMGARANAILALASSNIMLLDHALQSNARAIAESPASLLCFLTFTAERAIEKLNLEVERCVQTAAARAIARTLRFAGCSCCQHQASPGGKRRRPAAGP